MSNAMITCEESKELIIILTHKKAILNIIIERSDYNYHVFHDLCMLSVVQMPLCKDNWVIS